MVNSGSYLRVLTPRTSNGVNLIVVDGQVQYKETSLPMSAKRYIEEQNRKLPDHLKKIIEVVSDTRQTIKVEDTIKTQQPMAPAMRQNQKVAQNINKK